MEDEAERVPLSASSQQQPCVVEQDCLHLIAAQAKRADCLEGGAGIVIGVVAPEEDPVDADLPEYPYELLDERPTGQEGSGS